MQILTDTSPKKMTRKRKPRAQPSAHEAALQNPQSSLHLLPLSERSLYMTENETRSSQLTGKKQRTTDANVDFQALTQEAFDDIIVPYLKFKNDLGLKLKLIKYRYAEYPKFHSQVKYQIKSSPHSLTSNCLDTIIKCELGKIGISLSNI